LNPGVVSCYLPRLLLPVRLVPIGRILKLSRFRTGFPESALTGVGFRHGGPKEKNVAVSAEYASLASRAGGIELQRVPELR
jgi:hypothetical protein